MRRLAPPPYSLSSSSVLAVPITAQSNNGELRLKITGPDDLPLKATVELVSQGNDYRHTVTADDQGNLDARRLPYGIYQLQIRLQGFAEVSQSIEIRSALPLDRTIHLKLAVSFRIGNGNRLRHLGRPLPSRFGQ